MTELVAVRVVLFSIVPLAIGGGIALFDRSASTPARRIEACLAMLFAIGVAGSGIGGFVAHLFLSDLVAESVGWEKGSPFQQEMGFANLALGLLGLVATGRRDGFRLATVIAATTIGLGATIVHVVDVAVTGNLAPGNTIQNGANLIRPLALVLFSVLAARAARSGDVVDGAWAAPLGPAAGAATAIAATAFAVGFALHQVVLVTTLGVGAAALVVGVILGQSASRRTPE